VFFLLPSFSFFLPPPFYFTRPIPFYFLSLSPTPFCSSDCILCNFIPLLSILYSVSSRIGVRFSVGTRNCFPFPIAATLTLRHVQLSIQWYGSSYLQVSSGGKSCRSLRLNTLIHLVLSTRIRESTCLKGVILEKAKRLLLHLS
jgi:hypothetical protein